MHIFKYIYNVLRTKRPTQLSEPAKFDATMVGVFLCVIGSYTNSQTLRGHSFRISQHFATKLVSFINLKMPFELQ